MSCFEAANSAINGILASWFDPLCGLCNNHLNLRLGEYKPDIALVAYA